MTDRQTNGQTDGRTDGQTDGRPGKNKMSPDPKGGRLNNFITAFTYPLPDGYFFII